MEKIFQRTKVDMIQQIEHGIKTFDCTKATCLTTDWCKNGAGFFLFQQSCSCLPIEGPHSGGGHWAVVFAGSRFTTDAESRLETIKQEIAMGYEHSRKYSIAESMEGALGYT